MILPTIVLPSTVRAEKKRRVRSCKLTTIQWASALWGSCLFNWAVADSPATPPTAAELLTRVVERAKGEPEREAAFKARYAFTRDRVLEVRDGSGELEQRDSKRFEHVPAQPATNGSLCTSKASRSASATGRKPRAYERQDFQLDRDLLARFRFEVAGSEAVGSRKAWRLNFEPAAAEKLFAGIKERFLAHIAGSAWVDDADNELVRLEVRLTAPVHVVGGLVGTVKACQVVFERARTADGYWFTRRLTWHLEGRQFFRGRIMDRTEEVRDVRPAGA